MKKKQMARKAKAERKVARVIQDALLGKGRSARQRESQQPARRSEKR